MSINNVVSTINLDANTLGMNGNTLGVNINTSGGVVPSSAINGPGLAIDQLYLGLVQTFIINSDFKTMHTTPVLILPPEYAPDQYVIYPISMVLQSTDQTVQMTGGGNVSIIWTSAPGGPKASAPIPANTFTSLLNHQFVFFEGPATQGVSKDAIVNQGLYLTCDSANFATGDADFVLSIYYRLLPTAG